MNAINVLDKYSQFTEQWSPRRIATLNNQQVIIAKVEGEFVWHSHEHEDELFYVVKGQLNLELRDKTIVLNEGEMAVVPRGVEHNPTATEECWILLFEPLATKHTGKVESDKTKSEYPEI